MFGMEEKKQEGAGWDQVTDHYQFSKCVTGNNDRNPFLFILLSVSQSRASPIFIRNMTESKTKSRYLFKSMQCIWISCTKSILPSIRVWLRISRAWRFWHHCPSPLTQPYRRFVSYFSHRVLPFDLPGICGRGFGVLQSFSRGGNSVFQSENVFPLSPASHYAGGKYS